MHSAYLIVTILAVAANIHATITGFTHPDWLMGNMRKLGVQERWLPKLAVLTALGAVGMLAGIGIPLIGVASAGGLVVYFVAATVITLRARWYAHLPYPLVWLVLVAGSLVLRLRSG